MNYTSTRSTVTQNYTSAQVIKKGLADDGGLFVPEHIVKTDMDFINSLSSLSYAERAVKILSLYLTDYTEAELRSACNRAYADMPANITKLENGRYVLELWHGPTCAFKDMALQLMPSLLQNALVKSGEDKTAHILVATSGDTGKAALEGCRDIDGIKITVYYPVDGVSDTQKLQMITQEGANVNVVAVRGNFDDCQNGVKGIFSDTVLRERLEQNRIFLSSANSINWGRLIPQVVYYISAYADMVKCGEITLGEQINVTVPTGNFGNILAAYIAREMGLPIKTLICASNMNNILTDFINTGVYDRNRRFYTTISPSMDILISSNLERLLYYLFGAETTEGYMRDLNSTGKYTVDTDMTRIMSAYYCGEDNTRATIKNIYDKYGYLCDPHTAVALYAAGLHSDRTKMLTVSTASPYKFADDVYYSLTGQKPGSLEDLSVLTGTDIPYPLQNLSAKPVRFSTVLDTVGYM